MIQHWGIDLLRAGSGVVDVGGDPGFLCAALLERGIPTFVVDPVWRYTGKTNAHTAIEQMEQMPGCPAFSSFAECFDEDFCARHQGLVQNCSVIVSLYGDEATEPTLRLAAAMGKPALVIPCNECVRFFPRERPNYDAYVQACVQQGNQQGGRFELATLHAAPFSRAGVIQSPAPAWARATLQQESTLTVPVEVLREMGVLHQLLWKMEVAHVRGEGGRSSATGKDGFGCGGYDGGPGAKLQQQQLGWNGCGDSYVG